MNKGANNKIDDKMLKKIKNLQENLTVISQGATSSTFSSPSSNSFKKISTKLIK